MSLAVTHRFNWMGYEGTESEALNIGLLRPGNDSGNMRNSDYNYRQEVTADIRLRLKLIKRDLGLLPPEDDQDSSIGDGDDDDVSLDSSDADGLGSHTRRSDRHADPLNSTRGDMAKLAERRRLLLEKGRLGDSDDDEEYTPVKLWPNPPEDADVRAAAAALGPVVRGVLSRRGDVFVSYLDAAQLLTLDELRTHNDATRPPLEEQLANTGAKLPAAAEFETAALAALVECKNQSRMKLDAVRCVNDPSYASKLPAEELDNSGQPITNVNPDDGDEPALVIKLNAAKAELVTARTAYNRRAAASAKALLSVLVNCEPKKKEEVVEEEKPQEEEQNEQQPEAEEQQPEAEAQQPEAEENAAQEPHPEDVKKDDDQEKM